MNNRKNKRNLKRSRWTANGLFGIKNIRRAFLVGEGEHKRTVEANVWTVYEKSTGNNLASGRFSQMMDLLATMNTVDPAAVVEN